MQKLFLKFSNVLFYFETKKRPMSKLTPIFGALENKGYLRNSFANLVVDHLGQVKIFSGPQHS